jgi:UPF0716 protein FxsA
MRLAWLFLGWTLIEIGLFVTLGAKLGLLGTWFIVLVTGVGGILLIRQQKRTVLGQVLNDLRGLRDPLTPAAHSALLVLAGVLLILPGFLTDAAGLILMLPPVRNLVIETLRARARVAARMAATDAAIHAMLKPHRRREDIVEATAEDVADEPPSPRKPSGWTKP